MLEIIENLPIMLDVLLKVCIKMKLMEILLAHTVNLEIFARIFISAKNAKIYSCDVKIHDEGLIYLHQ